MEKREVSEDDLLDVTEMTQKIEYFVSQVLKENEFSLRMSALISSTINCMVAQCETLDEVIYFKNIMMEIFDQTIKALKAREKD